MCGLVGFSAYKNNKSDPYKLKYLLLHNSIDRGKDACGFYNNVQGLIKDNVSCQKFFETTNIQKSELFIGHVRAKTVGMNSKENAHPFMINDDFVMVHNGTLTNYCNWANKYNIPNNSSEVDSFIMTKIINKAIKDNNLSTVLSEIPGAAAIMYTNKDSNTIYAYRNTERPLFYGWDDSGIYISSTKESLESIDCHNITEFETHILYSIIEGDVFEETDKIKENRYVDPKTIGEENIKSFKRIINNCEKSLLYKVLGSFCITKDHVEPSPLSNPNNANLKINSYYQVIDTLKPTSGYSSYPDLLIIDDDKKQKRVSGYLFPLIENIFEYNALYVVTKYLKCANSKDCLKKNEIVQLKDIKLDKETSNYRVKVLCLDGNTWNLNLNSISKLPLTVGYNSNYKAIGKLSALFSRISFNDFESLSQNEYSELQLLLTKLPDTNVFEEYLNVYEEFFKNKDNVTTLPLSQPIITCDVISNHTVLNDVEDTDEVEEDDFSNSEELVNVFTVMNEIGEYYSTITEIIKKITDNPYSYDPTEDLINLQSSMDKFVEDIGAEQDENEQVN